MKKVYEAVQTGQNKWEKRTYWDFETKDVVSMAFLVVVFGYVVIRALIG